MPPRKAPETRSTNAPPPAKRTVPPLRAAQRRQPSEDNAAPQQEAPQPKRHELAQTDTLSLVPPSSNFHTVLRLFFHSDHWVFPLRADIDALLSGFEQRWASRMGEKSSMQVMKALWSEMGWKWVLLLGCPEGPLRRGWGQTVVRAFVEHLRPENPPLRQVAALFALYLLTQTQARGAEKLFVEVDPDTLEYINSLPSRLAPALDTPPFASPAAAIPPPSADLAFALSVLLQSSSFHLVPSVSSHAWPFVHVKRNAKLVHEKRERALLVLGAEEELERITRGDFDGGEASEARGTNRKRRDEEDVADAAGESEAGDADRNEDGRLANRLVELRLHRSQDCLVRPHRFDRRRVLPLRSAFNSCATDHIPSSVDPRTSEGDDARKAAGARGEGGGRAGLARVGRAVVGLRESWGNERAVERGGGRTSWLCTIRTDRRS